MPQVRGWLSGIVVAVLMSGALVASVAIVASLSRASAKGHAQGTMRPAAPILRSRLHLPPVDAIERFVREDGLPADASADDVSAAVDRWLAARSTWFGLPGDGRGPAHELAALSGAMPSSAAPLTVSLLALPVEFSGSAELDHLVHNSDASACITVTAAFTGPMHGSVPYPGGGPLETIDNQTLYYPSTEPEDYARLIFGREGYTQPLRQGDPNVNDGAGVDVSGLTVETYFDAQSDGTVNITGTVAPWVDVPHPEALYGIDQCIPGASAQAIPDEQLESLAELTVAAAEALKATGGVYATHAFWSQFDRDGDGSVDALWIIHAGRGQEYGGGSEGVAAIWSRASELSAYDAYPEGYVIHDNWTPDPTDDVRLDRFTMLPEDSDIGVMIEEFGHSFFGLPDLYTMRSSNSVGWWAPMSSGIWGGELGGTRPVNMPLFHRMVADCAGSPCGWADPVEVLSYTTEARTVVLGQAGEPAGGVVDEGTLAGETIYEGLRIDLPDQIESIPNQAGEGGGAYSTSENARQLALSRALDLGAAAASYELRIDASWQIPRIWGFGYVEVSVEGGPYVTLPDLDGLFTDENPFGNNDGFGLTGSGSGTLRFDLTPFVGRQASLRLRYHTYQGGPGTGWWIDNVSLGDALVDDFESGLGDWRADGWIAVPVTRRYPQYYLVEWRNANGFDESLLGAYSTSFYTDDEWRVERVPANVPGAVVMLRNLKYPLDGTFTAQLGAPPSYGSKYGLLVVDPSFWPTRRPSGAPFAGRLESLDAALALGDQADYSLEVRDAETGELLAVDAMTGSQGVQVLDDAFGYYPGFFTGEDGVPVEWDQDASAVLPSRDGAVYSTRITRADRSRPHPMDGKVFGEIHRYGTGNPGDDNLGFGVHIEVIDQASDGSWGAVRVYNGGADYALEAEPKAAVPGGVVTYTLRVANRGSVGLQYQYVFSLPEGFEHLGFIDAFGVPHPPGSGLSANGGLTPGDSHELQHVARVPPSSELEPLAPTLEARADFSDGTDTWVRTLHPEAPVRLYLPRAYLR